MTIRANHFGFPIAAALAMLVAASCSRAPQPAPQINAPAPPPASAASLPPAKDASQNGDERLVSAAQRALAQLGYPAGPADGVLGPATLRAVLAFQKDHGLAQDGRITASLVAMLNSLATQAPKINSTAVAPGDLLLFGDGSRQIVTSTQSVLWDSDNKGGIVAIRPSTAGWPPAARAGLDWATSHALDAAGGPPVLWSSTGVEQKFTIIATPVLSAREAALAAADAPSCRHLELRGAERRYPGIACRDKSGEWYFLHSKIRLAHPARALAATAVSAPAQKHTAAGPR